MVPSALDLFQHTLHSVFGLALPLGLTVAALAVALLLGQFDRERLRTAVPLIAARLPAVAAWGVVDLALGVGGCCGSAGRRSICA